MRKLLCGCKYLSSTFIHANDAFLIFGCPGDGIPESGSTRASELGVRLRKNHCAQYLELERCARLSSYHRVSLLTASQSRAAEKFWNCNS